MIKAIGYAAKHSYSKLKPMAFEREEPGKGELEIAVLYCGVCHSDVHQVKNEWGNTVYPCMPGHEIVGRVTRAGGKGSKFKAGDIVGVGCMIDSCRTCAPCSQGEEQYCEGPNSWLATYNGPMKPAAMTGGVNGYGRDNTFGGYSDVLVVREEFVLRIPDKLSPEAAAPILCAGVTTWSPLKHWGVKAGDQVGVIGFGGLGDMAVKLARALGAEVFVFTTTPEKVADAEKLGATGVVEGDKAAYAKLENSFDLLLSTVPEKHKVDPFVPLLKRDKAFVAVGALEQMSGYDNSELVKHRKSLAGSLIGSVAETQEVLDFCAEHGIAPEVEVIPVQEINRAYKRIERGEVRYRYVIDMATLKAEAADAEG